jgi:hypothetical protein
MSARLLVEIALRVMGLWFFFTAIGSLTTTVSVILSVPSGTFYIWGLIATIVVQLLIGGVLVFCAPAMAAWFYPTVDEMEPTQRAIGPGDVYRTASFVLGVYLLVAASHPAGRLLVAGRSGTTLGPSAAADAVTLVVHVASGLVLVFGSRRIAELLANLRYDPDTIPKQQLSLAMVLIFIVLVAVALGVFRIISVGP